MIINSIWLAQPLLFIVQIYYLECYYNIKKQYQHTLAISLTNLFKQIIILMSNKSKEDLEFQAKLAKTFYKTTAQNIGKLQFKIPTVKENGINGKFTDHLIYSGMYKNASLNTTPDRDRWVNGSKDWMEHLG